MNTNTRAGQPADKTNIPDVTALIDAYYEQIPDPNLREQQVIFGTSGHRGLSIERTFNENHILAITQAICNYRKSMDIYGPLFLGIDTHALSIPAFKSAMEVLAANDVEAVIAENDEFTPTPVISRAILTYNRKRKEGFADGIVITPSHNPPDNGGFKYNPPHGGPAEPSVTGWIEKNANSILKDQLRSVKRVPVEKALKARSTHYYDFMNTYINDLHSVVDMDMIQSSGIRIGVDPMGGAGVHYWNVIADRYGLNLTVLNKKVDPTFQFMTLDWDGKIRMDPSSPNAMQRIIHLKNTFDIGFACDTDHDRHGIVTPGKGLIESNQYLTVAIWYLLQKRPQWSEHASIGKTIVSSEMIGKVTNHFGRKLYEVPVGFKWFVEGLLHSSLAFAGEESAGASFLRRNGEVWTTDKDGIVPALLAAEITANMNKDPGEIYERITEQFGQSYYTRIEAPVSDDEKERLEAASEKQMLLREFGDEEVKRIITRAPGNNIPFGGIKAISQNGWFAIRPSGTEPVYKLYAESFMSPEHLKRITEDARDFIENTLIRRREAA